MNRTLSEFLKRPEAFPSLWPEQLASCVEVNDWHLGQSVLDHGLRVRRVIADPTEPSSGLGLANTDSATALNLYLATPVVKEARRDLLIAAALLHDAGKLDTMTTSVDGRTECPRHALASANRLRAAPGQLTIAVGDWEYLVSIVERHHDLDEVFETVDAELNDATIRQIVRDPMTLDLLVFYFADYQGCQTCSHIEADKKWRYHRVRRLLTAALASGGNN